MIDIELVEGCNFKCYFCRAKEIDKNVYIDLALFKRIIDESAELGFTTAKLTPCRGEPFLHPHIYEILEYSCSKMKHVRMFTNATAINVDKLKRVASPELDLCISFYGATPEKFIELTQTNEHLFRIFHDKLKALDAARIKYTIHRRDENYTFSYDDSPDDDEPMVAFDTSTKCQYHQNPKVLANGDVTFCNISREEMPDIKEILYANVNNMSMKDVVQHPMRYKFFDSQSVCATQCSSFGRARCVKYSITTLKMLTAAKKNYLENQEATDATYRDLERAVGLIT